MAVSGTEFARIIGPALTLTSPSGMTQDERKAWAHAAYKAIGDVSREKLEPAVMEAMKTADHPSKIVPAIRKYLEGPQRFKYEPTIRPPSPHELIDTRTRPEEARELSGLMKGLLADLERKHSKASLE